MQWNLDEWMTDRQGDFNKLHTYWDNNFCTFCHTIYEYGVPVKNCSSIFNHVYTVQCKFPCCINCTHFWPLMFSFKHQPWYQNKRTYFGKACIQLNPYLTSILHTSTVNILIFRYFHIGQKIVKKRTHKIDLKHLIALTFFRNSKN